MQYTYFRMLMRPAHMARRSKGVSHILTALLRHSETGRRIALACFTLSWWSLVTMYLFLKEQVEPLTYPP